MAGDDALVLMAIHSPWYSILTILMIRRADWPVVWSGELMMMMTWYWWPHFTMTTCWYSDGSDTRCSSDMTVKRYKWLMIRWYLTTNLMMVMMMTDWRQPAHNETNPSLQRLLLRRDYYSAYGETDHWWPIGRADCYICPFGLTYVYWLMTMTVTAGSDSDDDWPMQRCSDWWLICYGTFSLMTSWPVFIDLHWYIDGCSDFIWWWLTCCRKSDAGVFPHRHWLLCEEPTWLRDPFDTLFLILMMMIRPDDDWWRWWLLLKYWYLIFGYADGWRKYWWPPQR